MPDDPAIGGSPQGAPSAAPPAAGGGPSAGATPTAGPGNGATPPLGGPAAGAVQPQGMIAQTQAMGSFVMQVLNKMLQAYHPSDETWRAISESLNKLSKHFPATGGPQITQPKMATGNASSGMPMPQMAGGNMSGGPLGAMAQRGPVPGAPQA